MLAVEKLDLLLMLIFQAPTPVNTVTRGDIDIVKLSTAFPDKQNVFEIHTKSGIVWYLQTTSYVSCWSKWWEGLHVVESCLVFNMVALSYGMMYTLRKTWEHEETGRVVGGNTWEQLPTTFSAKVLQLQYLFVPNKMPILAFMHDAVPNLFPLYASQIFKAIFPSQLKYCITVLEIIPEIYFWKRHGRGRYTSDSCAIQGYFHFLFIHCITLFEIILEIVFGKRHDPGQITYLTQKTEDNIIVEDKN